MSISLKREESLGGYGFAGAQGPYFVVTVCTAASGQGFQGKLTLRASLSVTNTAFIGICGIDIQLHASRLVLAPLRLVQYTGQRALRLKIVFIKEFLRYFS